jgi:hypothetical protein
MNELRVRLPAGDVSLEGLMHVSARGSQRAAVLCHPHPLYGGQMDNNVLNALVDALIGAGFDTLRFNFRGVGNSEGRHGDGLDELHDVVGAVEHLLDQSPATHLAVVGYSFGAAVGLKAGMMDCSFLSRSRKPKLLVSGDRDTFAPLAAFAELYGELPEPREMLLVKGADHFYLGHEPEVARATVEYLDRVLRPPEASAAE